MLHENSSRSEVTLKSDDLNLLQRFLEAWCEEHHVDLKDDRAAEVASALIDWYRSGMTDRDMLKSNPPLLPSKPDTIQHLLRRLSEN
ncbi:MAG: hypothetical protein ACK4QP_20780 [Pseudorhizobium sp.]